MNVGVLLAAGAGQRMGGPKALAKNGRDMLIAITGSIFLQS